MGNRVRRNNEELLHWLRSAAIAAATYGGLAGMGFKPGWAAAGLAILAGVAAAGSMDLGVIVAVLALAIPVSAANPVVGILFIVLGIVGVRYLGADGGRAFLIIAASIAGAFLGPVWAAVAIAGYLMSAGSAALVAGVACVAVEVVIVALDSATRLAGSTISMGSDPILNFRNAPDTLLSGEWAAKSFGAIDSGMVDGVLSSMSRVQHPMALIVQPLIWGLGAVVVALAVRKAREQESQLLLLAGVALGTIVPAAGAAVLYTLLDLNFAWNELAIAALSSMVIAVGFAAVFERAFALIPEAPREPVVQSASMAAEDADVDELLRLVATCEEKLATQHTTNKVVMITDMKSFSRMTEEEGSIVTAKAIQQHRDMLLPVIESYRGHGKSTGGDGIVAAFEKPAEALGAAVDMQRALEAHNRAHPSDREMAVRIGVAQGEVILDKGGRPFIGSALNLAARVMNLADGGQAFATADVAHKAGRGFTVHSHGAFQLKNIASPVEVVELLWHEEQTAREPRDADDQH